MEIFEIMQKFCFLLIIMVCSVVLIGCENQKNIAENNIEEANHQISTIQILDSGISEESLKINYQDLTDLLVDYFPEINYHTGTILFYDSPPIYICWRDLLVIGDDIYRRENGIYKRTNESLENWLDLDDISLYRIKQWENMLITVKDSRIIVYDLDSKQLSSYPFDDSIWYVNQGKIYYREFDKGIFCMNLLSGESQLIYACKEGGDFRIRDNGDMIICTGNIAKSNISEFWLLSYNDMGQLNVKKIGEFDYTQYEFKDMIEFNAHGLFLYEEFYSAGGDYICLTDNGEKEEIVMHQSWTGRIIAEEGYFLWDGEIVSDSVSYYSFQGNKLGTFQIIESEMLDVGYHLVCILYNNGEILAFYENEELDDLYISRVQIQ